MKRTIALIVGGIMLVAMTAFANTSASSYRYCDTTDGTLVVFVADITDGTTVGYLDEYEAACDDTVGDIAPTVDTPVQTTTTTTTTTVNPLVGPPFSAGTLLPE